jgi:hypothetical protein
MSYAEQMPSDRQRALRILARSLFKALTRDGFETGHVVSLTTELLDLAMQALRPSTTEESHGPDCVPE